jgi:Stage II sporulation protein E (SpoIIE)
MVATVEKRRTERSRNFACRSGGRPRSGPNNSATAKPSKPLIHTAAATAWVQSATRGNKLPVAAAWLSPVRVISSKPPVPVATPHPQDRPELTPAVIAAAVSSAKASRMSQTSPTLLPNANAGHNLPCRRHDGQADELRARGMPLGLMPGMSYEEKEVVLKKGESALFYSDGLVEAHDPEGEMFGFPRLRRMVAEHAEVGSLVDFLMDELRSFTGGDGWEQEDDITLVALQRSAASR